jgi:two-component system, chemotaxis family, chemotaxis protein CheY
MIKILIADDFFYMRLMLKNLLVMNDFDVVGEAEDGQDAVEKYKELHPDVVLMDVVMPRLDGIAASKMIRQQDPKARIALISAVGQQDILDQAAKIGINHYILKPFSFPDIIETLNKMMEQ